MGKRDEMDDPFFRENGTDFNYELGETYDYDDEYFEEVDKRIEEEIQHPEELPERKKKKRRKKHYFARFLIFCAVIAGIIVFLSSSFFDVKNIKVEGNVNYNSKEIVKMSGLKTGRSIFKIKKGKAVDALMKDSYVEEVKIKRDFPDTVRVIVSERKEIATVPYGKNYIIIDKKGYVLRKTEKQPKLTVLMGLTIKSMDKGKVIEVKETKVLDDTLDMLKTMAYSDLFFKKIDMSNVIIKAYVYDELICKGTPKNILTNMKNGNLETIIYDLYKKKITKGTINVGEDNYCSFSPKID